MKLLTWSLVSIACVSLSAQGQSVKPLERWVCGEDKCQAAAAGLPDGAPILVTLTANSIEGGNLLRLKGSVEIHTRTLVLQADEADYQWVTGEFKARGNVRIKPVAQPSEGPRPPNSDFQTFSRATPVRQSVQTSKATLSAASMTPESGTFHLKGAVQIRTDAFSVTADEATYRQPDGEIDAPGEVHVKPMPTLSPGLAQFGIK